VGCQHQNGIDIIVDAAPANSRAAQTDHRSKLAAGSDVAQSFDAWVITPFVHHEKSLSAQFGRPIGLVGILAERFLHEDGYAQTEHLGDHREVGRGGGRDDDSIDFGKVTDDGDDDRCTPIFRARATLLSMGHHGDNAAQFHQVSENVPPPHSTADQRDSRSELHAYNPAALDSYDNAMAESFNGLFKWELIYPRGPWSGLDDVEFATLGYIDWFNHRRLHGQITDDNRYITPAEFEAAYYRQMEPAFEAVTQ
jgi:hypothetical protein